MELIIAVAIFAAGYAFRGAISREIKAATAELKSAVAEAKAELAKKL